MSKSLVKPHIFFDWIREDEIKEKLQSSSLEDNIEKNLITRTATAGNFTIEKIKPNNNGKPAENLR